MIAEANFQRALIHLFEIEGYGDIVDIPGDSGGRTAWGIAENYWPEYWVNGPPDREIAIRFYRTEWWVPLRLHELTSWKVAAEILECAVNTGHRPGARIAQRAYNALAESRPSGFDPLRVDGWIGPKTLAALNGMSERYEVALYAMLNWQQGHHYLQLDPRFRIAWFNRRIGGLTT